MRWILIPAALAAMYMAVSATESSMDLPEPAHPDQPVMAHDAVAKSFEREFKREPVPSKPVRRESIDDDILYRTVNSALWTPELLKTPAEDRTENRSDEDENSK